MRVIGIALFVVAIVFWQLKPNTGSLFGGFGLSSTFYTGRFLALLAAAAGAAFILFG